MIEITLGDERVVLLPCRALYWPRFNSVIVADLHFGKDSTFRRAGIPVPLGLRSKLRDIAKNSNAQFFLE